MTKEPTRRQLRMAMYHIQPPIQFLPDDHAIVRKAAAIAGVPVAQFIRVAAIVRAEEVIRKEGGK